MASATAQSVPSYVSVDNLLGGKRVLPVTPLSPIDWVAVIRRGLPAFAIDSLTRFTRMTQAELSLALGIPERTLARRKREGKLNSEESSKLVRLARVIERAFAGLGVETDAGHVRHLADVRLAHTGDDDLVA